MSLSYTAKNTATKTQILSELEIKKADLLDAGGYSCIAENMFGRRSKNITLQVISEHKFIYLCSFSTSSVDNLVRSKPASAPHRLCIARVCYKKGLRKCCKLSTLVD